MKVIPIEAVRQDDSDSIFFYGNQLKPYWSIEKETELSKKSLIFFTFITFLITLFF